MQIVIEKPKIYPVSEARSFTNRRKIGQTNRGNDPLTIYSCLKEFEIANFETQYSKMKFSVPSNTSTLSGNICKIDKSGLSFLQTIKSISPDYNLQVTETGLEINTDREIESSSRLTLDNRN